MAVSAGQGSNDLWGKGGESALFTTPEEVINPAGPSGLQQAERVVRRDHMGRYLLPDVHHTLPPGTVQGSGSQRAWTRATTFAKSISDTYTLSLWQQRMVAVGLARREDLLALVAAHADAKVHKALLDQVCEDAKTAASAKTRANLGTAVHAFTEQHDRGELSEDLAEVPEQWRPEVRAWAKVTSDWGLEFPPEWIERVVVNTSADVAGTFDRLGRLTRDINLRMPDGTTVFLRAGTVVVVDLKTGSDLQYGWNEIVIQLALYATADGIWDWGDGYEPMPENLRRDVGLVVHVPVGAGHAEIYAVDLEAGRRAMQLCADVRRWRAHRKLAVPLQAVDVPVPGPDDPPWDTTEPSTQAAREPLFRGLTALERIERAASLGELAQVWYECAPRGQWSRACQSAATRRRVALSTA